MKRIFLICLLMLGLPLQTYGSEQWTAAKPLTGDNPVSWPADNKANMDSLDRLLAASRKGMQISYVNASSVSVGIGSATCADGSGVHYMRQNIASSTLTTANLDVGGSFSASTVYYVYENCSANATTATFTISLNSTTPTGVTAYRLLGSFITDGSSNILYAGNFDGVPSEGIGVKAPLTIGTTYQALTDSYVKATVECSQDGNLQLVADTNSNPSTEQDFTKGGVTQDGGNSTLHVDGVVAKGEYFKVVVNSCSARTMYIRPIR